jgi:hypothetical protein
MGHSLYTNMQYSKSMGVKRLDKEPINEPAKIETPKPNMILRDRMKK